MKKLDVSLVSILLLSADSADRLRACDVDRVMTEAAEMDALPDFKEWLLKSHLQPRTRSAVIGWEPENEAAPESWKAAKIASIEIFFDSGRKPKELIQAIEKYITDNTTVRIYDTPQTLFNIYCLADRYNIRCQKYTV